MKNYKIANFMLLSLCCLTLISGCSQSTLSSEGQSPTTVDSNNGPSILSERMVELPPTKMNNYGFTDEVFTSGNLLALYPKVNKELDALGPIEKRSEVQREIDQAKESDWMLFESDDAKSDLLVIVNQHRLKLLYFNETEKLPASCEFELKDGNFINYAKSVVYLKNDVLLLKSQYPSSASYESIFIHLKQNNFKLLEIRSGDAVVDQFNLLRTLIREGKTNEAVYAAKNTTIEYPDRYIDEIIDINKLFFYHLSEKAKSVKTSDPETAAEWYWDALQLVLVLEEERNEESLDLGYDMAMMIAESDTTVGEKLIDNAKIASVLNAYLEMSDQLNLPVNDALNILSEIFNKTLK